MAFFTALVLLVCAKPAWAMRASVAMHAKQQFSRTTSVWPPDPKDVWALLSFTGLQGLQNDDERVSSEVTPHPWGVKSEMPVSSVAKSWEMHVFVPRTAISADVVLYAEKTLGKAEIGTLSLGLFTDFIFHPKDTLLYDYGWCSPDDSASLGCPFDRRISGDQGITVTGKLTTGSAMYDMAKSLNMRGIKPLYTDRGDSKVQYSLARVPVENVEDHVAYARTGSVFPSVVHGLFWMDQRGVNLPAEGDPEYSQVCQAAADEVVVGFGEAAWDADKLCVAGQDIYGGGPLWGHWTWFDQTGGDSAHWRAAGIHKPIARFCFTNNTYSEVDIWRSFMVGNLVDALPEGWDFKMGVPPVWTHLRMNKKAWGWDRETQVMYGALATCHYPVWQIVDGDGKRTEHYEKYLRWATNQSTNCPDGVSSFQCHMNRATDKTQLVARAESDLCGYSVLGAVKRYNAPYADGKNCKCSRGQELTGDSPECDAKTQLDGRKFNAAELFAKGCRCGDVPVNTRSDLEHMCSRAVIGATVSGKPYDTCTCPPSSELGAAYAWGDSTACDAAGTEFSPLKLAGKGCQCGEPRRCCCKSNDPSTCKVFRGEELDRSVNPVRWQEPVCPSGDGYRHVDRFGFATLPVECQ